MTRTQVFTTPGNFRDMGGLAVAGGTFVRGRVFRSDDITTADDQFLETLVSLHGVTQVIDLRAAEETSLVGFARLGERGLDYHNVALGGQVMVGFDLPSTPDDMAEFYVRLMEQHAGQMVSVLSLIAWSPRAIVFHCAGGKDRTGMLAAMLLRILGASEEEIISDYGRTKDNLGAMMQRWLVATPTEAEIGDNPNLPTREFIESLDPAALPPIMDAQDEFLSLAMEKLTERYGDPLALLYDAGLDTELETRLRAQLIEPGTA